MRTIATNLGFETATDGMKEKLDLEGAGANVDGTLGELRDKGNEAINRRWPREQATDDGQGPLIN
jgi:hypothetical protein